jgi:hypothetical protein
MLTRLFFYFILLLSVHPMAAQPKEWFDPEKDPVLSTINGKVRFVQSEELIVRAADIRLGRLNTVETFDKLKIENDWYITFECRFSPDPDQSAKVYLKLRPDNVGNYFADTAWVACIGRPCGSCDWDPVTEYCFCKVDRPGEPGNPGDCNQVWSTDPLLKRTKIKPN